MNRTKHTAPGKKPSPHKQQATEPAPESAAADATDETHVVLRPDGYYAQSLDGELGPFATAAEAREALGVAREDPEMLDAPEEDVLDTSAWLDPDTLELDDASVLHVDES